MVTIGDIDKTVRLLTGEHREARPFLCEGSPIGAQVFLVGINPGTDTPFWPHWQLPFGCDKEGWLAEYRGRHARLKPTRDRVEILFRALCPVRCLETNIFSRYSPDERSLPVADRDTRVFDFLLYALRPRVVFVHGASAIRHLEIRFGTVLPKGQFTPVECHGRQVDVIAGSHLSRGWSRNRVQSLGDNIRQRCLAHLSNAIR